MQGINSQDTRYLGSISTIGAMAQPRYSVVCLGCGSSLAKRFEAERLWGGKRVRVYRCECKRRRLVEVAA